LNNTTLSQHTNIESAETAGQTRLLPANRGVGRILAFDNNNYERIDSDIVTTTTANKSA